MPAVSQARWGQAALASGAVVAYQGEPGAYSEEALLTLFPSARPLGRRTFAATFEALLAGEAAAAVLPVENTLGGVVREVCDLLWERAGLRLVGEYVLPIRHCLLGFRGAPIRRVLSHPQALAQVRRYLEARGLEAIPYHDTAGAARRLAERPQPGLAAVASAAAAARYGLEVLATGIQDDPTNRTRFVVAERGEPGRPGQADPGSKCSVGFVTAHVPGSLVRALQCFSAREVNLTRLESRPIPDRPFEYRFFVDFQVADPTRTEAALGELEASAAEVRLFGTYGMLGPPGA
jgi:prephenate dehydratase